MEIPKDKILELLRQLGKDAAQTAKESRQEHAQQLKDSAQETAQDAGTPAPGTPQYSAR